MKDKTLVTVFVLSVLGAAVAPAQAEVRRAGGEEALAKAQYLLQQMSQEQDALKAQNAKLQGQVDSLSRQLSGLKKGLQQKKRDLSATGNELARYKVRDKALLDRLLALRNKFKEVIAKFRQTIDTLRQVEIQRNQLKTSLEDRTHEVQACIKKNIDLYKTDLDLVNQYEHKGVWAALLQKEPVTGLKKVEIENAVQKYNTRLEKLRAEQPVRESANY